MSDDFVKQVSDALRVLIDENVSNGPPMRLTCDYLAPRVAAAILTGIGEVPLAVLASREPPDEAMLLRPRLAALAVLRAARGAGADATKGAT